jgi:hypothetical protein
MVIISRKKRDIYNLESVWIDGYIPDENKIKDKDYLALKSNFGEPYKARDTHLNITPSLASTLSNDPNSEHYMLSGNLKLKSISGELLDVPKWIIKELPMDMKQENPFLRLYMDKIVRDYVSERRQNRRFKKRWYEKENKNIFYRKFTGDSMLVSKGFSPFYDDISNEDHDSYRQIILISEKRDFPPVIDCAEHLIKKVNFDVKKESDYKNYAYFKKSATAILDSVLQVFNYLEDDFAYILTSKINEADIRLKLLGFNDPLKFYPLFGEFFLGDE